ncbi:MAG: D-alanyl-D-alanine carboxypeptidase/D-alanyl-D-alanine-endopeptidase [Bacteroidetes bacterium]|nr:D-alanyl-D-alanine carboxypeptidase/D-alanyl-D-alanine-endopeptidase [Bacteroidota bacterium]
MKRVFNRPGSFPAVFSFLVFLLSLIFPHPVSSQKLQSSLNQIDTSILFRSASWGVVVMRVSDGKILAAINKDKVLIPASSLKIAVTFPAWKIIGPDHRFETTLQYDGGILDSVLHGNIYIKGEGDPTLGSWRFPYTNADSIFARINRVLQSAGIRHVNGGLIIDTDVFDDQPIPSGWLWDDIGNYYAGGVSGLNFRENQLDFVFNPGKATGEPARLAKVDPAVQGLNLENKVVTGTATSGDQVIIYGGPYDYHRVLEGSVPLGKKEFTVKGSMPDPACQMGQMLYNYLIINNITFLAEPVTSSMHHALGQRISANRKVLDSIRSPLLGDIIKLTHEKSINLYADCLLKQLGRQKERQGSYSSGIHAVKEFWESMGLDVSTLVLNDGSGLSLSDRISPFQLASMMRAVMLDNTPGPYLQTLNLAGHTGDLKDMKVDLPAGGTLRAKTGYMKTVRSIVGVVDNGNGNTLVFCIMVNHSGANNLEIKQKVIDIVNTISRSME